MTSKCLVLLVASGLAYCIAHAEFHRSGDRPARAEPLRNSAVFLAVGRQPGSRRLAAPVYLPRRPVEACFRRSTGLCPSR